MKLRQFFTFLPFCLLFISGQIYSQVTCGATAGALSGTWANHQQGDTTASPVFSTNPAGLTHTEFIVINPDVIAPDELGPLMLGVDTDGRVLNSDYGLGLCDAFCVVPFSYNLQEIKILVNALFNNQFQPGIPCCVAAEALAGGFCDTLIANGISDSSDVTGLADLRLIVDLLSGGSDISFQVFIQTVDILNGSLPSFGACSGGLTSICYATDTNYAAMDCYRLTNTPIPAMTISALPDSAMITTLGGTVQYSAFSLPNINTDSIVWSMVGGTAATIDPSTGLVTGQSGADTLWVIATAPNSCVSDTIVLFVNIVSSTLDIAPLNNLELKILSNPFQSNLRFEVSKTIENFSYTLYDATGKAVSASTMNANTTIIEVETRQLPAGIYHLQVRSGKAQVAKTVVKY
jgi:hypothetical protein